MAVFDLAGKASGRPLWSLLGAAEAAPVTCNATLVVGRAGRGRRRRRALGGARLHDLQAQARQPATTSPRCARCARRLGPEARIRIDANGAWSVDEALGILRLIEPLGIELAEQPVASDRRDGDAHRGADDPDRRRRDASPRSKEAERAKRDRACDLATVKLAKVGGIGEANGIAQALPIYLSSALDGPLGIAAAAHAAQVLPSSGAGGGPRARARDPAPVRRDDRDRASAGSTAPLLSVPDGPGLGVELDEDALASALRI